MSKIKIAEAVVGGLVGVVGGLSVLSAMAGAVVGSALGSDVGCCEPEYRTSYGFGIVAGFGGACVGAIIPPILVLASPVAVPVLLITDFVHLYKTSNSRSLDP